MKMYRHGDIFLREVNKLPVGAKKKQGRVIAEGEATGHKHKVKGDATLYEKDGVLYLAVEGETAPLTHQEHKTIEIPKGNYEIIQQQEYTPEVWRMVVD